MPRVPQASPARAKGDGHARGPRFEGGRTVHFFGSAGRLRPARRRRQTAAMLDERWIRSLHVESLREEDLHAERDPHVLFQASTIGALLDGAYDGDLTFAELAEHGDLGLGTLNGLDGEMIALDGEFYRADVDGGDPPRSAPRSGRRSRW